MDGATANLIFLDKIEQRLTDLLKLVGNGNGLPDHGAALSSAILEQLSPAVQALISAADAHKAMTESMERDDDGDGHAQMMASHTKLVEAVAGLQNTMTISANRAGTETRAALAPVVDSLRTLLAGIDKLFALVSKKRKYKMKIDRNHQTKLIQGVEIIETEGE